MKNLIKLEEAALFALAYFLFIRVADSHGWFWALILAPDIGMIGYLVNTRIGAISYNLFHHRGLAVVLAAIGFWLGFTVLVSAGLILLAHASLDRLFGYGLKYPDSFKNTHLGPLK